MDENSNFETFLPFIIFVIAILLRFLKRKKKEEPQRARPVQRQKPPEPRSVAPPPVQRTVVQKKENKEVPRPLPKRRRRPRIVRLVQGLHSKKELILLSEILTPLVK